MAPTGNGRDHGDGDHQRKTPGRKAGGFFLALGSETLRPPASLPRLPLFFESRVPVGFCRRDVGKCRKRPLPSPRRQRPTPPPPRSITPDTFHTPPSHAHPWPIQQRTIAPRPLDRQASSSVQTGQRHVSNSESDSPWKPWKAVQKPFFRFFPTAAPRGWEPLFSSLVGVHSC